MKIKKIKGVSKYLEIHIKDGNLIFTPLNKSNLNIVKKISGLKRLNCIYCG